MKLRWIGSYETIKFDTPDGDLDLGQYAVSPKGGFFVRRHPKNNFQFINVEKLNEKIDTQEVHILPGEFMYYDEFELPSKRTLRLPSSQTEYKGLAVKNAPERQKDLSLADIEKEQADDHKWQDVPIEKD